VEPRKRIFEIKIYAETCSQILKAINEILSKNFKDISKMIRYLQDKGRIKLNPFENFLKHKVNEYLASHFFSRGSEFTCVYKGTENN